VPAIDRVDSVIGVADEPIDVAARQIGRRYRVDWKHERLRRTFRSVGTLVSIEEGSEDEPGLVLTFKIRPRFGKPALQRVHATALRAIEPVADHD
jgi:hypothetical protein